MLAQTLLGRRELLTSNTERTTRPDAGKSERGWRKCRADETERKRLQAEMESEYQLLLAARLCEPMSDKRIKACTAEASTLACAFEEAGNAYVYKCM